VDLLARTIFDCVQITTADAPLIIVFSIFFSGSEELTGTVEH